MNPAAHSFTDVSSCLTLPQPRGGAQGRGRAALQFQKQGSSPRMRRVSWESSLKEGGAGGSWGRTGPELMN